MVPNCRRFRFNDDEARRWARVDRHQIELVATDMDVPGQDRPAGLGQPLRHERLGSVAGSLGPRAAPGHRLVIHGRIVSSGPYPGVISRLATAGALPGLWSVTRETSGEGLTSWAPDIA